MSFPSENHDSPDHLEVTCVDRTTHKRFTVVGIRIHASATDEEKRRELEKILRSVCDIENVIIAGDFNNARRGFKNNVWCLSELASLSKEWNYELKTPSGGSIYEDNDGAYSFPEDHFLVKGEFDVKKLYDYDRGFTKLDLNTYRWGTSFQKYCGRDERGRNVYEHINDPFPDHAILEADIDLQ